jgi:chromosome segregation ATPase
MRRSLRWGAATLFALMSSHAVAQDIPGLELCTAEKQMERRTGCLQSNDDFLQRTLVKLASEMRARIAASDRALAAAQAEIAALKSAMEKLNGELSQLRAKGEPATRK